MKTLTFLLALSSVSLFAKSICTSTCVTKHQSGAYLQVSSQPLITVVENDDSITALEQLEKKCENGQLGTWKIHQVSQRDYPTKTNYEVLPATAKEGIDCTKL